jgi:hypothetical protein
MYILILPANQDFGKYGIAISDAEYNMLSEEEKKFYIKKV